MGSQDLPEWAVALDDLRVAADDASPGGLPVLATTPAQPAGGLGQNVLEDVMLAAETGVAQSGPLTMSMLFSEAETPPSPMYTGPSRLDQDTLAPLPPPKDKPEATDMAVRAMLMGRIYEASAEEQFEGPSMPQNAGTAEPGGKNATEDEQPPPLCVRREQEILNYVGIGQRRELWDQSMALYQAVPNVLAMDENLTRALRLLQEAQDILLEAPRQFDVAAHKVSRVDSMVQRRKDIVRWSNTYGWLAFFYEISWLVLLIPAVYFAPFAGDWIVAGIGGGSRIDPGALSVLWNTMVWGGIGGVIGAFYSLYWHVAKVKDFDKQYMMWYIVQPVVGLLIGGLVHLLIGSGLLVARGESASGAQIALAFFPYAVSCIAGFRQRFILEIIDRIVQLLTPSSMAKQRPANADTAKDS